MYPFDKIQIIKDRLIGKGETVAVAESVTSGHLQAALSLAEDARRFFEGGLTAYNLGQKARHLRVEPIHALDCDCVSGRVAEQMALEASRLFTSTYGMSVTGYAAKVPEKGIAEPFAFFSICREGEVMLTRRVEAPAETLDALRVQLWFTRQVLEALVTVLTDGSAARL